MISNQCYSLEQAQYYLNLRNLPPKLAILVSKKCRRRKFSLFIDHKMKLIC